LYDTVDVLVTLAVGSTADYPFRVFDMSKKTGTIKYFAYVRKSSERDEKQKLSIPAQIDRLNEQFGHLDIEIIEEKGSAFKPHNRPLFAGMLERIRKKERTGLIAWHPDRLSRNEIDAGSLTYMLRMGVIEDLKLATYHFENTPEGIWMLQMALSQSQYESAKKSPAVKRGLLKKAQMGVYPAPAPIGYLNDKYAEKGSKTILPDPERFDTVRKMFDLMLGGNHNPKAVLEIATNEWGLRTKKGKPLSRSTAYTMFENPLYYGEFEYPKNSGTWYKGIHKPMITKEEYDRIQEILGKKSRPRRQKHTFAYRGPINCGSCGAMITAEKKTKRQKNGNVHHYVYYHCTKKIDPDCSEPAIEEKDLEEQIVKALRSIQIPTDFKKWALARLKEMNKKENQHRNKMQNNQRREYDACVRKLDNLIDMRAEGELTSEEFLSRKQSLTLEKQRVQDLLNDTDQRVDNWLEVAEKVLNFAEKAANIFVSASKAKNPELRKEIFSVLGSNLTLKDKKLLISWDDALFPLKAMAKEARATKDKLEPLNNVVNKGDNGDLYSQNPKLLRGLSRVRT